MIRFAVSLFVFACLVHCARFGVSKAVFKGAGLGLALLVGMFFSDELGSFRGWTRGGYIDEPTPGVFIRGMALLALVGLSLFLIFKP